MFYHEVRHFETQQHKDNSTLKYLHILSGKLVFYVRHEPITNFSLPVLDEWNSYREGFIEKIEGIIKAHRRAGDEKSNYVYLCIKSKVVERFEFDLIEVEIPLFVIDKYLFDIQSICYVRAIDFCNFGIDDYMRRNKKHLNAAYISWIPVTAFRDGFIFIAAMPIDKALSHQLYPPNVTINFPYEYWKYLD